MSSEKEYLDFVAMRERQEEEIERQILAQEKEQEEIDRALNLLFDTGPSDPRKAWKKK